MGKLPCELIQGLVLLVLLPKVEGFTVIKGAASDPAVVFGSISSPADEILESVASASLVDDPVDVEFFYTVVGDYRSRRLVFA